MWRIRRFLWKARAATAGDRPFFEMPGSGDGNVGMWPHLTGIP